jgi:CHASE3 domain sensor protein
MKYRRPRFLGGGATVAALAVVAVLGFLEYRSRGEVLDSVGWVTHTLQVQAKLGLARSLITEAETGQRGYLLTMNDSYLEPNEKAIATLPGVLSDLRQLTADNPSQQQRLDRIDRLAAERIQVLKETVALGKQGDQRRAIDTVIAGRGQMLMNELRDLLQAAVNAEDLLLQQRERALSRSVSRRGTEVQILIGGMAIGLIIGALVLVRLNEAQRLVTVCSWSKTVEYNGEWLSYDEYLRRRFHVDITQGISPDEYAKLMGDNPTQDLRRI